MAHYTTILFDWDGCLAKTLDIWMDAYKAAFESFQLFPSEKDISTKVFGDWKGPHKVGVSEDMLGVFTERMLATANAHMPLVDLYEGAKELLIHLHSHGYKVGLVSTSAISSLEPPIRNHDIAACFDVLISGDQVTAHKPHPESLYKAMEAVGAKPNQTLMVGDSAKDMQAAMNAGVDSALFYPENHTTFYDLEKLREDKPTYVFHHFNQLKQIIEDHDHS